MIAIWTHLKKVIRADEHPVAFLCSVSHGKDLNQTAVQFFKNETLVFLLIGVLKIV